jgi:ferredoxin-thioredoxin reductase catalytic subunit
VGKTSLIKGLVKHYTKQNLGDPRGPITLVTGKKRRITLLECPPDLPGAFVTYMLLCYIVTFGWLQRCY